LILWCKYTYYTSCAGISGGLLGDCAKILVILLLCEGNCTVREQLDKSAIELEWRVNSQLFSRFGQKSCLL